MAKQQGSQDNRGRQLGQLGQQLSKAFGNEPRFQQRRPALNTNFRLMKAVDSWTADGEDHINMWFRGQTELGQALDQNSPLPLKHSHYGRFITMQNFWNWIGSENRDDRLRTLRGPKLTELANSIPRRYVPNMRAVIADANYQRIKQFPALCEALKSSTLPLDIYFVNQSTGLRRRPPHFDWFIDIFEEIRTALKENREPDFKKHYDKPDLPLYVVNTPVPPAPVQKPMSKLSSKKQVPDTVLPAVLEMIKNAPNWRAQVPSVGTMLYRLDAEFSPKAYGFSGLATLLKSFEELEVRREENGALTVGLAEGMTFVEDPVPAPAEEQTSSQVAQSTGDQVEEAKAEVEVQPAAQEPAAESTTEVVTEEASST